MKNQKEDLNSVRLSFLLTLEARARANSDEKPQPIVISSDNDRPKMLSRIKIPGFLNLNWKIVSLSASAVVFVLCLIWVMGNLYFVHFKLGSALISANTSSQVINSQITEDANNYKISIKYPSDVVKTFSLDQAGVKVNMLATDQLMQKTKNSLSRRLAWWQPISVSLVTQNNQKILGSFIANNISTTITPPKNASLSLSNGKVELSKAALGQEYGFKNPDQAIDSNVSSLSTNPLVLKEISEEPVIDNADLASTESTLNQILNQHIAVTTADKSYSPDITTLAGWIELTPNLSSKTVGLSVNNGAVSAYVNSIADTADQPPEDQVNVISPDGSTSILVPGIKGISIGNTSSAISSITQSLLSAKGVQDSLSESVTPYGSITSGNYSKWIEVDATNKRLYAFQYGQLINTFLVTAGKPSTPTPLGDFQIWEKLDLQTMIGPDYVQPDVPWINYFDHSGDAIHGNYWRPASYFGNINSSHGCVGVQVAQAEWIYDWAPIGTPVIIHA